VLGASIEEVGALKSIITGTDRVLKVTGALTNTFASHTKSGDGGIGENYLASASYSIGGSAKIKGSDVVFEATDKITIKASGITISITPSEVKIDGKFDGTPKSAEQGSETYG